MSMKTPLSDKIARMVAATGPLTIAEYMHLCHADPQHGYYTSNDPLGVSGDFITAPEISQMFGEIIGAWVANVWMAMGAPTTVCLAEMGPGRGTLMADMLRVSSQNKEFTNALSPYLVETSPKLIKRQKQTLANWPTVEWVSEIQNLPNLPTIFIGNEFLDALPFRQFIKQEGRWRENCIDVRESGLEFTTIETSLDTALLPKGHETEPNGSVFETAPAREAMVMEIAEHLKRNQGVGLLIDYGHAQSGFGDTFQAVRNHEFASPLDTPGLCDLTSHVDFEAVAIAMNASGISTANPLSQGDFLVQCGLLERAGILSRDKSENVRQTITADVERLAGRDVSKGQMGELFKVLCFAHANLSLPPFEFSD